MDDLIAKLEALTGPSREVDAEIARACGIDVVDMPLSGPYTQAGNPLPEYTKSIDAALTLVPDGWHGEVSIKWGEVDNWAILHDRDHQHPRAKRADAYECANSAIALCIAYLRATDYTASRKSDC